MIDTNGEKGKLEGEIHSWNFRDPESLHFAVIGELTEERVTIGLGIEDDLHLHRGTGAITWEKAGWQRAGLTRVDWGRVSDPFHFKASFKEVVEKAHAIRFDVTNFSPFHHKPGMTNFEFEYILNSPSLLQKTTFIRDRNRVFWNGKAFINLLYYENNNRPN